MRATRHIFICKEASCSFVTAYKSRNSLPVENESLIGNKYSQMQEGFINKSGSWMSSSWGCVSPFYGVFINASLYRYCIGLMNGTRLARTGVELYSILVFKYATSINNYLKCKNFFIPIDIYKSERIQMLRTKSM